MSKSAMIHQLCKVMTKKLLEISSESAEAVHSPIQVDIRQIETTQSILKRKLIEIDEMVTINDQEML